VREKAASRASFRKLHDEFFTLPNAVNVGEARKLADLGFKAIASTSHGLSLVLGKSDLSATLDETLTNLRTLVDATDLPVNADFEAGFASNPTGVGANVKRAAEAGVAGLSIEDRAESALFDLPTAVERLRAARAALDAVDPNLVLVGRSEGYLIGVPDLAATIDRLKAYAEAGADVLYAPGVSKPEEIKAIVAAVAPKPVNVILVSPQMRVGDLKELGVRRVSVGGFLETASWTAFEAAARSLKEAGALPAASFGR
jgi:2-methylisocitrate lyase-like PEP mutase family enzyme